MFTDTDIAAWRAKVEAKDKRIEELEEEIEADDRNAQDALDIIDELSKRAETAEAQVAVLSNAIRNLREAQGRFGISGHYVLTCLEKALANITSEAEKLLLAKRLIENNLSDTPEPEAPKCSHCGSTMISSQNGKFWVCPFLGCPDPDSKPKAGENSP